MKFLAKGTLKNGTEVQLFQNDTLADCPAVPMLLVAFAELLEKRMSVENLVPFQNTNSVIWAKGPDDTPIAATMFSRHPDSSHMWMVFSYVKPEWRRLGLNHQIYRFAEADARRNKLLYISSFVHPNNTDRLESYHVMGFSESMIRMTKELK